jgi:hypothetical protein
MRTGTRTHAFVAFAAGLLPMALSGCSGEGPSTVPTEPIQVAGGQFISGPLPGTPPGAPSDVPAGALEVTGINLQPRPLGAGWTNQSISGLVTSDATAVGVEFADMGSGYWVVVVGGPDTNSPGQSDFSFTANFNASDPPGTHQLRFVAIGASGKTGPQNEGAVCFDTPYPDNLHACEPSLAPPAAVVDLKWDTGFDLDLHVTTPDGIDISGTTPTSALFDAGLPPQFEIHSLSNCVVGGLPQEDLVFQDPPPHGTYQIRVDPFASCGQPAVHFTVTAYVSGPADVCAACRASPSSSTCTHCQLVPVFAQSGELLGLQATGGASPGLFVANQTF